MKKFLVLVLALACALTMFSCNGDEALEAFVVAADATNPAVVVVDTTFATALGDLTANTTKTYNEDGSYKVEFTYDKMNSSAEGAADEAFAPVTGTVNADASGNLTGDTEKYSAMTADNSGAKLTLNAKALENYSVSADGNTLTATVKAENTKAVLGIEIAADVTLTATKNADAIVTFTVEYAVELGTVTIVCSYR